MLGNASASTVIAIHTVRCKGCGYCVEFCPKGVLRMQDARPVVVAAELCTGCALCVQVCPDFAMKVSRSNELPGSNETK